MIFTAQEVVDALLQGKIHPEYEEARQIMKRAVALASPKKKSFESVSELSESSSLNLNQKERSS